MELRFRFFLLGIVGLVAVAVWTFPVWRGYLRQRGENDAFPGLALDLQDDFLALPADRRADLLDMHGRDPEMALEMALSAIRGPEVAPPDQSTVDTARALVSGEFQAIDSLHWGVGRAIIYELPDSQRILRFEDFTSATGGNLRVYLARDPQPLSVLEVGSDFRDLGRLKGNEGDQTYLLPADLDVSAYKSAVVFCIQFNTVITVATLR